jgi:hypothetical protein
MPIFEYECAACGRVGSHVLLGKERTSRPQCRDDSYYRDSRNVGMWAKKRAQQMGVDLGSKFDETVEKARTGKLIKDME